MGRGEACIPEALHGPAMALFPLGHQRAKRIVRVLVRILLIRLRVSNQNQQHPHLPEVSCLLPACSTKIPHDINIPSRRQLVHQRFIP
jgi:hypothetical protein